MQTESLIGIDSSGVCSYCHHKMDIVSPQHYYCNYCQQNYIEQYNCPICHNSLQLIQGCGAVNYLCPVDGLISSKKIIIHYSPE
ncbi:zinc-ribbon domain-containing protein [Orbaceae bacterium ESL0721]|nr:zinc-ribbon domain-containing protein [Orbaceae bacterium ESL0721]